MARVAVTIRKTAPVLPRLLVRRGETGEVIVDTATCEVMAQRGQQLGSTMDSSYTEYLMRTADGRYFVYNHRPYREFVKWDYSPLLDREAGRKLYDEPWGDKYVEFH